ncbi:hypothetical protein QE405_004052 [Nocardioides zeae]|uniref:Uncharacterized protein n=1 Tax=Nocardioides zeae TaxID=1457234 RepID=A0AAJ1U7F4_9ACTN|nr:hypothetical protein [Nocardioides zeae]
MQGVDVGGQRHAGRCVGDVDLGGVRPGERRGVLLGTGTVAISHHHAAAATDDLARHVRSDPARGTGDDGQTARDPHAAEPSCAQTAGTLTYAAYRAIRPEVASSSAWATNDMTTTPPSWTTPEARPVRPSSSTVSTR